jgi:Subtilase family/Peptidase inhibitor I9
MRVQNHRLLVTSATAGVVVAALAVAPAASAKPAKSAKVTTKNVIVVLKNQHTTLKPQRGKGRASERANVIASDQSGIITTARKLGATRIRQYNVVNAFAATIKSDKVADLSRHANVAAVVPDLPISRPQTSADAGRQAQPSVAASGVPYSRYCSSNPRAPRIEPEAMQTMHVAYDDPNRTSASKLEDGSGVKVAWIADGLDINNPDFIRADGSHVFVDYQDFSGDGLRAQTPGGEAFLDAGSIAAQGQQTYNLNDYSAEANADPQGCYVNIRGVAPGASLVGLKVFGNSNFASTSHFISAIQYAVTTAGVDVLNESFGGDPFPDNMDDPISLANNAAIAAGVTVVTSTGDQGQSNTIGSPASSSQVIAVSGSTTLRPYVQRNAAGFSNPAAGITGWADDNMASLDSAGYAQNGKVPDVTAPGDATWALCAPDPTLYTDCTNFDDEPTSFVFLRGTSISAPLTSGTAALVVAAYKRAHGGARPSPALVKSIITGTAQELGHPAWEQGSGEVDALAAVKAALSAPAPGGAAVPTTATGGQLITSTPRTGVNQLDLAGAAGTNVSSRLTVTNASPNRQTVSFSTRSLTKVLSTKTGNINLAGARTFRDQTGVPLAFRIIDVNVPVGADRLDGSVAMNSDPYTVFMALIDPFGVYQNYNSPVGVSNYSHVDVRYPAPGHWKAMIWADPHFTGNINYEFKTSKYTSYGKVSPLSVTLAAGASATVTGTFPTASTPGDSSAAVVMKTGLGTAADVPVSIRTLIPTSHRSNFFHGVLTGGNAAGFLAQTESYYLNIPAGRPAVSVSVKLTRPHYPNETLIGFLVGPNGHTQSSKSNWIINSDGAIDVGRAVFNFVRTPLAGRWKLVLVLANNSGGQVVNQPFTGAVRFNAARITATGLPTSHTTLTRGKTYNYTVTVTNTSPQQQTYFADPRLDTSTDLQNLSLPNLKVTPQWLVPTGTTGLNFTANATLPVSLDVNWTWGDPEVFGAPIGSSATVTVSAHPEVGNGPWFADAAEQGPFRGPAPSGTVALNAVAHTKAFDFNADSSLGDYWISALIPAGDPSNAGATGVKALSTGHSRYLNAARYQMRHTPVREAASRATLPRCADLGGTLETGQSCTVTFTINPGARHGATVSGHLHIETYDFADGTVNDLASLRYAYKVK